MLDHLALRAIDLGGHPATVSGLPGLDKQLREGDVVDLDLSAVRDGDYDLRLRQCNPVNGSICTGSTRPLRVRRQPYLSLLAGDLFLSQNGDGFWETASAEVLLDPAVAVRARWRITSDRDTVAGPYDLSAEELVQAKTHGLKIAIDPRARLGHALPAGDYRFEVEATALEPDFTKTKVVSVALHVSNTAPITKLTLNADAFYPNDTTPDVPHVIQVATPFDVGEARYGGLGYRVLTSDGRTVGGPGAWWSVDPTSRRITWDGHYYEQAEGYVLAPAGTYRIELIRFRSPAVGPAISGPVSPPFTLSHRHRGVVEKAIIATARASLVRTVLQRAARVRPGRHGRLRWERRPGSPEEPWVETLHAVRVPGHVEGTVQVKVHGGWGAAGDVGLEVVTPRGRVVPVRVYGRSGPSGVRFFARDAWIGSGGRLRFKLLWHGRRPAHVDQIETQFLGSAWVD